MIALYQEKMLREDAVTFLRMTGFPLLESEISFIEVVDFGLGEPLREGAQILTLFSTERISAKIIVLFPGQILPEHLHPPVGDDPGKEEILRGYWGKALYYEEGLEPVDIREIPIGKEHCYTCGTRRDLTPGKQVIIPPGKKHWMKGGEQGGCIISFSTCVRDILDQFTDKSIVRTTQIITG